ncbi:hypothetical protein [uncultured Microbulbifer sp.]|uniref:hypothetical protein n=1 Tax=uncultured Microbulbifer sp. TaxID=348147 RepID=UPI0026180909|nr:hypothetical protein [uncultured Microbulbifer sp.]
MGLVTAAEEVTRTYQPENSCNVEINGFAGCHWEGDQVDAVKCFLNMLSGGDVRRLTAGEEQARACFMALSDLLAAIKEGEHGAT